jgi:hypothetical protein
MRKFIARVSNFFLERLQNGIRKRNLTTVGAKKEVEVISIPF